MPRKNSKMTATIGVWCVITLACLAALIIPFLMLVEAPPPSRIVMATGRADGAYHRFAQRYADLLRAEGITLELRETKGSVENLALLQDESSDVSIALVQGGIASPESAETLDSLCSLYWEPLWIFHCLPVTIDRLSLLQNQSIAVGPVGSGTRGIATQLLAANELGPEDCQLVDLTGAQAAAALLKKEIDSAFFVAGADTGYIRQLLEAPSIKLVELSQAAAYARRFRFLSTLTIPPGGLLDLDDNMPSRATTLVAPCATLICKKSLHPALIALILSAATKVHGDGDLLTNPGEFPSTRHTDLPLNDHATQFFRYGPPVLQRLLPFWLASLVDRLKIMIIPLVMLLMPLLRAAPPLVRWRTRRRIYLWYAQLRQIDRKAIQGMSNSEAEVALSGLNKLEMQLADMGIPLSYMEEYYNLRMHLNLVRSRVSLLRGTVPPEHSQSLDQSASPARTPSLDPPRSLD